MARVTMFQRFFVYFLGFLILCPSAYAASFDVPNIQVQVQAQDAVKARDQAILQAQRQGFAVLTGKTSDQIANIADDQIARLVNNFSVQGERMTAQSYSAIFDVRFDPNRTQAFIQSHGFDLVDLSQVNTGSSVTITNSEMTSSTIQAGLPETIVLLPILDIGARRILWDEPNPWRDLWQKNNYSDNRLKIQVPLGDVSDIADVPDASLLDGKTANLPDMLSRYSAQKLYVAVIKNQGAALGGDGGAIVSLYRDDDTGLKFIKKTILHPRPGHTFDDAIPAVVQMIEAPGKPVATQDEHENPSPVIEDVIPGEPMSVTVPYQSLGQWVSIQRRLRAVPGIRAVFPVRVSPSSAVVKIIPSITPDNLNTNLRDNGFQMQSMPNGEVVLTSP